jgi:hypothetical protein
VWSFFNMKITGSHKIRSLCQAWLSCASAAWRLAKAGSGALALSALWLLPVSCLAIEPSMLTPLSSNAIHLDGSTTAGTVGNHSHDLVIVEPEGRSPRGFQFQIVLDSATRGAESSLDLAANAAGLLVTARDVDGIGNDLDLIIKSANSFAPIGIWINNHHGGFIKADARVYALSIWSESPQLLSFYPTDTLCRAFLIWHQSYVYPMPQRFPGERWIYQCQVERPDLDLPSRLTADPNQTRGPPSLSTETNY